MVWELIFWLCLGINLFVGFVYFRDLGDVSQMVLKVKRSAMLRAIRNEKRIITIGALLTLQLASSHLVFGIGPAWAFWSGLVLAVIFYGFPLIWIHLGLRNQQGSASYYSVEEARTSINPATSVLVIENGGQARAHSDYDLGRPHLASSPEGLGGENLMMTYCGMSNLGMGIKAEVNGSRVELEVLAQHGNNLILRNKATGEPVQQIYAQHITEESDDAIGHENNPSVCQLSAGTTGMPLWPTYRMSFRAFEKTFPQGEVFLNKPVSNPFLRLFDTVMDAVFLVPLAQHRRENAPVMDNMSHYDDRLLNKTPIWGIEINGDSVAYTEDYVFENDGLVNAVIGGRAVVIAYDLKQESMGAWYNNSGQPVTKIDFWGQSDQGQLERVESMRPGMYWHVWAEFFPSTDINRNTAAAQIKVA